MIVIGGDARRVKTITSNTVIQTDTKWEAAAATQAYKREWEYKNAQGFGGAPGTSDHVEDKLMTLDEVHIAVVDEDGDWSGTVGQVIETFPNMSVASGATVKVTSPSNVFVSIDTV